MHQGKKLKQYIKNQDFSFSQVSRKLNHRSKNTIHNWFNREELSSNMFEELINTFPNIMSEFGEVELKMKQVPVSVANSNGDSEFWKNKFFQMEEENRLLAKENRNLSKELIDLLKAR